MPDFLACEIKEPELKKITCSLPFFYAYPGCSKKWQKRDRKFDSKKFTFSLAATLLLNKDPIR